MAERTEEEVKLIFTTAEDSVTVINNLATLSSLTDDQKKEVKRNVEHLEIIKAMEQRDGKRAEQMMQQHLHHPKPGPTVDLDP